MDSEESEAATHSMFESCVQKSRVEQAPATQRSEEQEAPVSLTDTSSPPPAAHRRPSHALVGVGRADTERFVFVPAPAAAHFRAAVAYHPVPLAPAPALVGEKRHGLGCPARGDSTPGRWEAGWADT